MDCWVYMWGYWEFVYLFSLAFFLWGSGKYIAEPESKSTPRDSSIEDP